MSNGRAVLLVVAGVLALLFVVSVLGTAVVSSDGASSQPVAVPAP